MKTCPSCDHIYSYEIIAERITWSGKFKELYLKCMFCDRIEHKTESLPKPVKPTYPDKNWYRPRSC